MLGRQRGAEPTSQRRHGGYWRHIDSGLTGPLGRGWSGRNEREMGVDIGGFADRFARRFPEPDASCHLGGPDADVTPAETIHRAIRTSMLTVALRASVGVALLLYGVTHHPKFNVGVIALGGITTALLLLPPAARQPRGGLPSTVATVAFAIGATALQPTVAPTIGTLLVLFATGWAVRAYRYRCVAS